MPAITDILQHTPLWVFALLALLVVLGCQALRARTLPLWRLLVVPLLFAGWGVVSIAQRALGTPVSAVEWIVVGALGVALAWRTARPDRLRIARASRRIEVPGSVVPLLRNLLVFAAKYALSVGIILAPAQRDMLDLCDVAVSGLMSGYFACWMLLVVRKYWNDAVVHAT
jgi:hypothetical protein